MLPASSRPLAGPLVSLSPLRYSAGAASSGDSHPCLAVSAPSSDPPFAAVDKMSVPVDRPGVWSRVRRAFSEFLAVPTGVMASFVALAIVVVWLDRTSPGWIAPVRSLVRTYLFQEAGATNSFLGMATTGLITMTSITFSMLLLALQQSASLIGTQVANSFLLRRRNQLLLGFFLGLTLFVLVVHAAAHDSFVPLLGAALALLLTMAALYGLAILLFTAVNQMRPTAVLNDVRVLTLQARERQRDLLILSYRTPQYTGGTEVRVHAEAHGYVRDIDVDVLRAALGERSGEAEVECVLEIGEYAAYGDELVRVRAERPEDAERLARVARDAVRLDYQRATRRDPSFGVEQLRVMGWSSGSTAYHNPGVALEAVRNLRDVVARWMVNYDEVEGSGGQIPLVYPDGLVERALEAIGALAVVSTESLQFATYEGAVRAYEGVFARLPDHLQDRVAASLRRLVTGLGDHILTQSLEEALTAIAHTLRTEGHADTADVVETARRQMASVAGSLAARSTRAQEATSDGENGSAKSSP